MLTIKLHFESIEVLSTGTILLLLYRLSDSLTSGATNQTSTPPIALRDIGYHGTWEEFCDPQAINEEFAFYMEHELRTLRALICDMNAENIESMSPFITYKYCQMMRFRADDLLEKLVTRLAGEDDTKKNILLSESSFLTNETSCLATTLTEFEKKCIDGRNPYFRMFRPILARACTSTWLNTTTISLSLDEACANGKMSGDIDWPTIIRSVPYRRSMDNKTLGTTF